MKTQHELFSEAMRERRYGVPPRAHKAEWLLPFAWVAYCLSCASVGGFS